MLMAFILVAIAPISLFYIAANQNVPGSEVGTIVAAVITTSQTVLIPETTVGQPTQFQFMPTTTYATQYQTTTATLVSTTSYISFTSPTGQLETITIYADPSTVTLNFGGSTNPCAVSSACTFQSINGQGFGNAYSFTDPQGHTHSVGNSWVLSSSSGQIINQVGYGSGGMQLQMNKAGNIVLSVDVSDLPTSVYADGNLLQYVSSCNGLTPASMAWCLGAVTVTATTTFTSQVTTVSTQTTTSVSCLVACTTTTLSTTTAITTQSVAVTTSAVSRGSQNGAQKNSGSGGSTNQNSGHESGPGGGALGGGSGTGGFSLVPVNGTLAFLYPNPFNSSQWILVGPPVSDIVMVALIFGGIFGVVAFDRWRHGQ
jgi:hypothetical protein